MKSRDALQRAVEQWREAETSSPGEAGLSRAARAAILERAQDRGQAGRLPPLGWLFFPTTRFVLAGVAPVALLTLAVGYLALDTTAPPVAVQAPVALLPGGPALPASAGIEATKDGDSVVFVIANGSRVHRVYASESPRRFDEQPAFTTQSGAFEDRLDRGGTLVFYRIE